MLQMSDSEISRLRRRYTTSDAALACWILSLVGLMLVPVPRWLLDVLLSLNLAGSLIVLLLAIHAESAMTLTTLPALLLLATLTRLSLGVAATRLILLDASAGEVIAAFGRVVVQGDTIVGAVVFVILVIVQFVVIARGSERVAEVAARFSLDAMPGRQFAIDGELRAGSIDGREAGLRRLAVQREGQFYGAMDGAMRFVRGDVVASLLITAVTLFGGIGVGIFGRSMSLTDALRRYALLTIGSGLATLLPALLLATAAGVLVTRVGGDEAGRPLGQELGHQLLRSPGGFLGAGALLIVLAVVPGLPALPFLVAGAVIIATARLHLRRLSTAHDSMPRVDNGYLRESAATSFVPRVAPWSLELGTGLKHLIPGAKRGRDAPRIGLETTSAMARKSLFAKLGVVLPEALLRTRGSIEPRAVVLSCHEVPELRFEVPVAVADSDAAGYVLAQLMPALERRAADFLGIAETQALLDELARHAPALVREVVPKPISVPLLTTVLRRLLDEGVPIRDFGGILETLSTVAPGETDPSSLVETVRAKRSRAFTFELTGGTGALDVYLLDRSLEDVLRGAMRRGDTGSRLTLAPAAARDVVAAVRSIIPGVTHRPPVLLTEPDIRYPLRQLLRTELPALRVVSHADLAPNTTVRSLATARIGA